MVHKKTLEVKIIDFDLSQKVYKVYRGGQSKAWVGTFIYLPPEILNKKEYSLEKAQVWELGVVLFNLLFSNLPFQNVDEILTLNITPKIGYHSVIKSRFQHATEIDFLASMLSKDPNLRPTLDQVETFFDDISNIFT